MNVFVTGGAGYIGSICAEQLLEAGHQVRKIVRGVRGKRGLSILIG